MKLSELSLPKTRLLIGCTFLVWFLSMFFPAVDFEGQVTIPGYACALITPIAVLAALIQLATFEAPMDYTKLLLFIVVTLANFYFLAICVFQAGNFYHGKRQRHITACVFACTPLIIFLLSLVIFHSLHVGYFLWLFSLQAAGILELLHTKSPCAILEQAG